MRIKEFAERTRITPRMLRHLDSLGLLRPRRGSGAYRDYDERDLERACAIRALQELGMSLSEVGFFLSSKEGPQALHAKLLTLYQLKRKELEEVRRQLLTIRRSLRTE